MSRYTGIKILFHEILGKKTLSVYPSLKCMYPANIYLFKVNNRSTRKSCEICSKLTTETPEPRRDVFLVFLLLNLNMFQTFFPLFLFLTLNKLMLFG